MPQRETRWKTAEGKRGWSWGMRASMMRHPVVPRRFQGALWNNSIVIFAKYTIFVEVKHKSVQKSAQIISVQLTEFS